MPSEPLESQLGRTELKEWGGAAKGVSVRVLAGNLMWAFRTANEGTLWTCGQGSGAQ